MAITKPIADGAELALVYEQDSEAPKLLSIDSFVNLAQQRVTQALADSNTNTDNAQFANIYSRLDGVENRLANVEITEDLATYVNSQF